MTKFQMQLTEPVIIRLEGLPVDVEIICANIMADLNVTDVSRNYPNRRGNRVRRYLTIGGNRE